MIIIRNIQSGIFLEIKQPEWMRKEQTQKQDLYDLIEKLNPNCIMAEIGCYSGESTEIFLSSNKIKTLYAIDSWLNGYDDTDIASYVRPMEIVEKAFDERTKRFKKVIKQKMKSNEAIKLHSDKSLDFVYIDAEHTYEAVKNDIQLWLPKIKNNGFLGGHDFYFVRKAIFEVLKDIDFRFCGDSWIKSIK